MIIASLRGDGHSGPLEAKPFAQLQRQVFEAAFVPGTGSRQHRCRRFVKQPAQTAVTST